MKVFFLLFLPMALFAKPQNLEVQHGSASIHEKGNHTRIENSPNAILHWQDFSIAQGESVHFTQENAKSTVLNRITSGQTSHLLGKLTSNGAVFLVNPSGVLIGTDAHIQTAGFLASTAEISNDNFLKGHYLFASPGEGHITNHGKISCSQGDIYLIAKTIQNTGTLQAENIAQISAYEVLITPHANEKVAIRTELDESEVASLTQDLDATNPYEKAIHHTGKIEAFGTSEENGKVYLIAHKREAYIEGSIKAPGGDLKVVGEEVYVTETATLNTSGTHGGSLFIGKGLETLTAQKTTLEKGAILLTSGTEESAGNILIWSETDTYCAATIEAAALGPKGDGGFLEISGKNTAEAPLIPNLSSANGKTGTILFDPGSITITSGTASGGGGIYGVTYLQGLLASSNVVLDTSGESNPNPQTLTITNAVSGANALTWSSNSDLSLSAGRNIEVQSGAQISFSGSGTLTATASGSIAGQTHPGILLSGLSLSATGNGNITLNGTGGDTAAGNEGIRIQGTTNLSVATGTLTLNGTAGSQSHGISITSGTLQTTDTGTVDLTGVGGSGADTNGIRLSGGAVDILAPVNGTISLTGTGGGTGSGARGVLVTSSAQVRSAGTSSLTINGTASPTSAGSFGIYPIGSNAITVENGPMNLTAVGGGVGDSNVGIRITGGTPITSIGSGDINIDATGTLTGNNDNYGIYLTGSSNIAAQGSGDINITNAAGSSTSPSTGGGNSGIQMNSTTGGILTNTGAIDITATGATQATGDRNIGINLTGSTGNERIESVSGAINIIAKGAPNGGSNNRGIVLEDTTRIGGTNPRVIRTGGAIDITAVGGGPTSGGGNIGIFCRLAGRIQSTGSTVNIEAIGDGLGSQCTGISMVNISSIDSIGDMIITATGSPSSLTGGGHNGIRMADVSGGILNTTGRIDITAIGATQATGDGNIGINLTGSTRDERIESVSGAINIIAKGAPNGGSNNRGIVLEDTTRIGGTNPRVIRTGGAIDITAVGGGPTSGGGNIGIFCRLAGRIQATGSTVNIEAIGDGLGSGCTGIYMQDITSISSIGDMTITAIGSPSSLTGGGHNGILMTGGNLSTNGSISTTTGRIDITAIGATQATGDGNIGINLTGSRGNERIESVSGAINIIAKGAPNGGSNNRGIVLEDTTRIGGTNPRVIRTGGAIDITAVGGGPTSGGGNIGIFCLLAGRIQSTGSTGSLRINATTGGTGGGNRGIYLTNISEISAIGNMTIEANSNASLGTSNQGIFMPNSSSFIRCQDGVMSITANGGVASAGIHLSGGSINTTGTGSISCVGTGGSQGILLTGGASDITAAAGDISLTGTGGGTATGADGIRVISGADVLAGGSGQITLTGTGSTTSGGSSRGILVSGSGSLVRSVSGDIILDGTGGNGGDGNNGVEVSGGGDITSTDGTIRSTITSLGGNGNANCHGILVNGGGSTTTTTNGEVSLVGMGGGSTAPNHGIFVTGGGQISSTGPLFELTGTGNGTGSGNSGINLNNATISQVATDVTLIGTGSPTGLNNNYGIELSNGTGITTDSGGINLTANGRGTGQNNHGIFFTSAGNITTTSGAIVINATGSSTGTDQCMGLLVDGAGTEITAANNGSINITATGQGNAATNPGLLIQNGGSILATGNAPITVLATGSTAGSSGCAGITLTGASSEITTDTGAMNLTGNAGGSTSDNSGIEALGGALITSTGGGALTLTGQGAGASQDNRGIYVTTPSQINTTSGIITATGTGGTGTTGCFGILIDGASAQILSSTGTVDLTGTGTGTLASNAGIRISNGATVASADTNVTLIGNGSTAGTDANYGIELLGSGITTGSGNISLTGNGGGTGQDNHGISFTSPGNITSTSGAIVIDANGSSTGTTQCMGLLVDGVGTEITSTTGDISVAGTGGGSGTSNPGIFVRNQGSIHSTSGAISLTGTAASGTLEGITLENQARVFTSGEVNVATFSDLLITDNSSIEAQGNNPATFNITTDVRILGWSGATTPAYINLTDGTASFTIGRDLILQGGTGVDSEAQIGNNGLFNALAPMTFQVGRDVVLTGGSANDSFAQIGHLDMIGTTIGGNISLTCGNDLSVLGGTDPSGYARIGHGGQMSGTISSSTMQLLAGRNINITSAVGDAQIVNENGPLTLVVDNLSPTFPGIGLGAFNLNSTLIATGELRIYTARQSQNTINDLINGAVFTPGAFDVNTDTEQWRTYFAGGTYEGAAFKFYYKDPIILPPTPPNNNPQQPTINPQVARMFFGDIAANFVELVELLPILQSLRAPSLFPNYHFKVCLEKQQDRKCSPNFSPYGSFIFEDSVWWIGESL